MKMKQVKVDVMLVEGDNITKAILDLIPILNIRKLVLGTTESSLRYHINVNYPTVTTTFSETSNFQSIFLVMTCNYAVNMNLKGNRSQKEEMGLLIRSFTMHPKPVRLRLSPGGRKSSTG